MFLKFKVVKSEPVADMSVILAYLSYLSQMVFVSLNPAVSTGLKLRGAYVNLKPVA